MLTLFKVGFFQKTFLTISKFQNFNNSNNNNKEAP